MIAYEHIKKGLADYIDNNIMSNFPQTGWKRVAVGAAVSIGIDRYVDILKENTMLKTIELVKPEGAEIEMYAEHLKKDMPPTGMVIDLPLLGELTMHNSDIDDVINCMHKAARGY